MSQRQYSISKHIAYVLAGVLLGAIGYFVFLHLFINYFGGFGNLERWRTISQFYKKEYPSVHDRAVLFIGSSYFMEGIDCNLADKLFSGTKHQLVAFNLATTAASLQEEVLHLNYLKQFPPKVIVVQLTPEPLMKVRNIQSRKQVVLSLLGFRPPIGISKVLTEYDEKVLEKHGLPLFLKARYLFRDDIDHKFRMMMRPDFRNNIKDLKVANNYTKKFSEAAMKKMLANIETKNLIPIVEENKNVIRAFSSFPQGQTHVLFVFPPTHPEYLARQEENYSTYFENEINGLIEGLPDVRVLNMINSLSGSNFVDYGHVDKNGRVFMTNKIVETLLMMLSTS